MMIRLCPNCACSVQGQQTKRRDEAQDGVMMVTIIRDDGYQESGLHDVQHPAQNTGNITSIKCLGPAVELES